ncbi:MAG: hypothetical protein ACK5X3_12310 [Pseudomonadota bacterium]
MAKGNTQASGGSCVGAGAVGVWAKAGVKVTQNTPHTASHASAHRMQLHIVVRSLAGAFSNSVGGVRPGAASPLASSSWRWPWQWL